MDRQIVYPGQIPLETDLLNSNRFAMVAIAKLAAAILGTATLANGLACAPTTPASLQVKIGPGEMYSLAALDAADYSSLAADTTHNILKQGISLDDVLLTCNPPGTAGQSINYLVQAAYQDQDSGLVTLPYYNASNPTQAWSGPNNSGAQQATARKGVISINAKAGIAATTGSQTTPAPDAGFTGLWVVTVANGQTTITAGNISQVSGAPFIAERLGDKISTMTGDVRYAPTGVIGATRNGRMSVVAASASATYTADEVVVEQVLGGKTYRLANFNKTINLATTGAGGMDTGGAPVSNFVAIYVIYNPITGASALLATLAGATVPEVYGGANMPAGYTASALVAVHLTNSSGQLVPGYWRDRELAMGSITGLSTNTTSATYASVPIGNAVPANAKAASVVGQVSNTSAGQTMEIDIAADSNGVGVLISDGSPLVGAGKSAQGWVTLATPQQLFARRTSGGGTPTFTMLINGYRI
jgi:hypothetical protein